MQSLRRFSPSAVVFALLFGALAMPRIGVCAHPFTIADVMSAPFASSLLASPKGDQVAWLMNEQGRRNIWVAAAPAWEGRRLTAFNEDDGQEIADLCWNPDESHLLFARGGDFENGHDNPNPALAAQRPDQAVWTAALDGSPARKLTEGRAPTVSPNSSTVAFIRGGQIFTMTAAGSDITNAVNGKGSASHLRWSPDGKYLVFVSDRDDHSFIGLFEPGARKLQFIEPSVDTDIDPSWSPDGSKIAFVRIAASHHDFAFGPDREGQPWSIRVYDVPSGTGSEWFHAKPGVGSVYHAVNSTEQLQWTESNALVFAWERTGWCHLYRIAGVSASPVELTSGIGEVEHVAASGDHKWIYFSGNFSNGDGTDIDRRHIWRVSADKNSAPLAVTKGAGIEVEPVSLTGDLIAYLGSGPRSRLNAYVKNNIGSGKALAPDAVPTEFPAEALVEPQPVMISAADGTAIHGQLFLPSEIKQVKHPALLFFHGGSRRQMLLGFHYMYYYSNSYALNEYLASKGYIVLSVNYRSGIGYGLNFREALQYGATGASEYNDVIGAALYLKNRPDVDSSRIGLWGGSYGGYLTALGLARASNLFAAGVDFHGVHDWNLEIPTFAPAYDSKAQTDAARIAFESSPLASVSNWRSPVLLIHGDDDRNVPFAETVRLAEALRANHVEFEQLIFPNEIHDLLLHRDWVKAYEATADFFARKMQAKHIETQSSRKDGTGF